MKHKFKFKLKTTLLKPTYAWVKILWCSIKMKIMSKNQHNSWSIKRIAQIDSISRDKRINTKNKKKTKIKAAIISFSFKQKETLI